jgi:hypothetical protein
MTARPPRKRLGPPPPPPGPDTAAEGARALDELLELHMPGEVAVALCRECMTAHPCRTLTLARIIAGEPPEETPHA